MSTVILPTEKDLATLSEHRDDASVTVYLPSSPNPAETAATRVALKNAIADAEILLRARELDKQQVAAVIGPLRRLEDDDDFWHEQARGVGVLAATDALHTFRLPDEVTSRIEVGERWDIGPLLRSIARQRGGLVLGVWEGGARLFELAVTGRPREFSLELPDDLHSVLEYAESGGQADIRRGEGSTGQRLEVERYCRIVQDAVLAAVGETSLPLILAAIDDFAAGYRAINTYPRLLDKGIAVHPGSLSREELDTRAREVLEESDRAHLADWCEQFGTRGSAGLATNMLEDVARAATIGAVEDLLFDADASIRGTIDDSGMLRLAPDAGPDSYDVIDEIAVRVYRAGGTVRAVGADDLPDGSPVAAMLRFAG